ncbi:MAG: hypothetical protein OIN90_02370, partial [Candidatus Methanoperedens sp.]|nr:hypothetical protein [Candidatus Methanoperedens sp.]
DFKATIANATTTTTTPIASTLSSAATTPSTSSQEAGAAQVSSPVTKPVDTAKPGNGTGYFLLRQVL